jgi:hypothetical protein
LSAPTTASFQFLGNKGCLCYHQKSDDNIQGAEIRAIDAGIKGSGLVRSSSMDATARHKIQIALEKFGLA